MKTIGLLGGMSYESTVTYYKIINETTNKLLGGLHSAKIVLYSVDFAEIEACQTAGQWDKCTDMLSTAAKKLQGAGADFIVICTNTMHKIAQDIQSKISIPILHIADVTATCIKEQGIKQVGLLGTRYTMQQDFYKQRLVDSGLDVLVPQGEDVTTINDIIFKELCHGVIKPTSKEVFLQVMQNLQCSGAQGIILGCTEIGLLISQSDTALSVFDTAFLHAHKAALQSLE